MLICGHVHICNTIKTAPYLEWILFTDLPKKIKYKVDHNTEEKEM